MWLLLLEYGYCQNGCCYNYIDIVNMAAIVSI